MYFRFSRDGLCIAILGIRLHACVLSVSDLTRALKCKPSAGDMIIKKPEE